MNDRANRVLVLKTVITYLQRMHHGLVSTAGERPEDVGVDFRRQLLKPSEQLITAMRSLLAGFRDHSQPKEIKAIRLYVSALRPIHSFGVHYDVANCAQQALQEPPTF